MKPEPSGLILRTITANLDLLIVFLGLIRYYKTKLKHLKLIDRKNKLQRAAFHHNLSIAKYVRTKCTKSKSDSVCFV